MAGEIPLERAITDKILRWLRRQERCWCFKVLGGGAQARGVPDIIGCWRGRFFALEVKRPRFGRVSPLQAHVIGQLRAAGAIVGVVYGLEDVRRLLGGETDETGDAGK